MPAGSRMATLAVRSLASLRRRREKERRAGQQVVREKISREVVLPEAITIRGYVVEKLAAVEIDISEPGSYQLTGEGELRKL